MSGAMECRACMALPKDAWPCDACFHGNVANNPRALRRQLDMMAADRLEAIAAAREAALREAMKVCDDYADEIEKGRGSEAAIVAATVCAARIRNTLLSPSQQGRVSECPDCGCAPSLAQDPRATCVHSCHVPHAAPQPQRAAMEPAGARCFACSGTGTVRKIRARRLIGERCPRCQGTGSES